MLFFCTALDLSLVRVATLTRVLSARYKFSRGKPVCFAIVTMQDIPGTAIFQEAAERLGGFSDVSNHSSPPR